MVAILSVQFASEVVTEGYVVEVALPLVVELVKVMLYAAAVELLYL